MDYVQAFVPLLLCLSLLYILNCSAMSEKFTVDYCSKLEATFSVPGWSNSYEFSLLIYVFSLMVCCSIIT